MYLFDRRFRAVLSQKPWPQEPEAQKPQPHAEIKHMTKWICQTNYNYAIKNEVTSEEIEECRRGFEQYNNKPYATMRQTILSSFSAKVFMGTFKEFWNGKIDHDSVNSVVIVAVEGCHETASFATGAEAVACANYLARTNHESYILEKSSLGGFIVAKAPFVYK